jgi:malate dehydrogenase
MMDEFLDACRFVEPGREKSKVGVWGFGAVSRDVVLTLALEELGQEIVFYSRPKGDFGNRAGAWIDDLKANTVRRPRMKGTGDVEDMAGLDVIFVGVGVPRKEGQTRDDLLAVNTEVIAKTTRRIADLYKGCSEDDLPVLVYMGNPVTAMTWTAYKVSGFPRRKIMGQAGNLDSRRICQAVAGELGLSGYNVNGVVFGDHGDSMVASPRFFSVNGIPLADLIQERGLDPEMVTRVIDNAKKGGTHFVNAVGQSASAGPARAAVEMLRSIIRGEPDIQPVVAVLEKEYGLVSPEDGLDSICFGVPAMIGPGGVESVIELPVEDLRGQLEASAAVIKENIRTASRILEEKFGVK